MEILIFAGSTRQDSYNRKLAKAAAEIATGQGAQATLLELADYDIPLYNADLEARGTPPDVIRFKQALHSHAAWIICCPEYNGSYPALLKNALDWASSPVKGDPVWGDGVLPFRGKVVGMCSASPGGLGGLRAQSHLAPLLLNLECWLAPRSHAVSRAADAFDAQGQLMYPQDQQGVQAVLSQVLWAAQRLHA
ncbi:NADPH-dependent FMN reductase [Comamonas resistens]|uniref:NAD(P)H-dependent oxidoreductase n=1 Tax=Comamonas resistens TaxID=3046670 RepID=A0ABY8SRE4_9BURK|nr:NAD(P)H-dependent oxidoreductase [Comamonas resistens]MDL5037203.1 NAD(P)H-dependent oxidoreductase [Comamonas resistens]WHS65602.1 NAD(P)H-dependent oxidoreductase [Comamonas resistens]